MSNESQELEFHFHSSAFYNIRNPSRSDKHFRLIYLYCTFLH